MLIRQKRRGNNKRNAVIAQLVEHFLGKEEVLSSTLSYSSFCSLNQESEEKRTFNLYIK